MPFNFLTIFLAFQANLTGIQIRLLPSEDMSPAGIQITLKTYEYREGEAFLIEDVNCKTDSAGACTLLLEKPNTPGMQRGTLQIGDYGTRDVIWPGGMLDLQIPLDQVNFGREAAPYEYLSEDGGVVVHAGRFPLYGLVMILILAALVAWLYQRAKERETV
jgi:hypothetical protein